jgi:chemotaxis protein CheZ
MSGAAANQERQAEQDNSELEALFDSIAAATRTPGQSEASAPRPGQDNVIAQLGHLTRKLHEAMRELGYDRLLQDTAKAIPDARDRLVYVATMTEKAAERTLSAIETAKPIQDRLGSQAAALAKEWEKLFGRELSVDQFKALAERTRDFLRTVPAQAEATSAQLMEIMMAQDFQDLTGQVIKRVTDVVQDMENQLLRLLLQNVPPERREAAESRGLVNGPVIRASGNSEVVTSQAQVDELLASLGF